MYDFEYLSDSSTSPNSKCNNPVYSKSQKNTNEESDCDSDSTIIEMNIDSITEKYVQPQFIASSDEEKPSTSSTASSKKSTSINKIGKPLSSNRNIFSKEVDPELDAIIKKYSSSTCTNASISTLKTNASSVTSAAKQELIELSSDDDELPYIQVKSTAVSTSNTELFGAGSSSPDFNAFEEFVTDTGPAVRSLNEFEKDLLEENPNTFKSPKKKRKISPDKEKKKQERAAQQAKKREEAETAKKLKQALAAANKNLKPEECMKFVTVLLDTEIANQRYGGEVLNALQAAELTYRLQSQLIPSIVTWNRKTETHVIDDTEQLTPNSNTNETDEVLLIIDWNQIVELVHSRSLLSHVKSIQSILNNKKLSLAIYGLENYFKYQKSRKQRDVRSEISQASQKSSNKYDKIYKNVPKIGKKQLELALTELQLMCDCCCRKIETPQDLGAMITQFTKAIAQAPYKLEKHQKQQEAEWYVSGDNKDCVRVDKNGNGLQRLWQQQLTTFPLARLEHAEAIVAKYPTPSSLMEEYSRCTQSQGEKLLQDIPIRRAAGPLTTVRKIGPELSRKLYKFFNSTDGTVVL